MRFQCTKGSVWRIQIDKRYSRAVYLFRVLRDFELDTTTPVRIPPVFTMADRIVTLQNLVDMGLVELIASTEVMDVWN